MFSASSARSEATSAPSTLQAHGPAFRLQAHGYAASRLVCESCFREQNNPTGLPHEAVGVVKFLRSTIELNDILAPGRNLRNFRISGRSFQHFHEVSSACLIVGR